MIIINKGQRFFKIISAAIILLLFIMIPVFLSSCSLLEAVAQAEEEAEEIPPGINVEVEIKEGMTLTGIADLLEETGVVDNSFVFRLFVEEKGKDKNLVPGIYSLTTGMIYDDVLAELVSGPPVVVYSISIPEGFTLKQVLVKAAGDIPFIEEQELEAAVDIANYDYDYLEDKLSLEGFLFPKTYEITIDYTASDIIEMMLAQYQYETGTLDYSYADEKELSKYDILTISSMIEREAYIPEERETISAVIHNRLNINMALGIDATLSYFLEKWEEPLTESDLKIDTQYNTRLYAGLPPTPICNPGLASIAAALDPAEEDYLYFKVTDTANHKHSFFIDYNDFLNAEVK